MKPESYLKALAAREIRKTAPRSPKSAVKERYQEELGTEVEQDSTPPYLPLSLFT